MSTDTHIAVTTLVAPCAVDRDAQVAVLRAIRGDDNAALEGLVERKKVLTLLADTQFEVSDTRDGISWGFVRSGRYSGETCYLPSSFLRVR